MTTKAIPASKPTVTEPREAEDVPVNGTDDPGLLQIVTLVIWLACLAIGLVGLLKPPTLPTPPAQPPLPPVEAELIKVDLTPAPPQPDASPPDPAQAPAAPDDPIPPLPAVAAPSSTIAFSLPVEGLVRIVGASQAGHYRPAEPVVRRVQRLTYGLGEGRQPKPDYPDEAKFAGEQGVVGVRFNVDEDGRVLTAQVSAPSRWPLLNRAAVDAVRDTWHFPSGPRRTYEVFIRFQLNS